jgi:hypothetical protein
MNDSQGWAWAIQAACDLKDGSGELADPTPADLIVHAVSFLTNNRMKGYPPPVYVYATASGYPMIEWHWPELGRVESWHIRSGTAELVVRERDKKPVFRVIEF